MLMDFKDMIPGEIDKVLQGLRNNGFEAYLVGGCVRDMVIGRVPKDYDICSDARPEDVKSIFPKVVETGAKHGTVSVLMNGTVVEVTTYRAGPIDYSVIADVKKRDFTINALLFDGEGIIDHVGGIKDINNKTIRAVGEPWARFIEDPLRMVRAVRLHCQLGFEIEGETLKEISNLANSVDRAAPERIRDELIKILVSQRPSSGIRLLQRTGLLNHIIPELNLCYGFEQHNPHHCKDVFEHIMDVLDKVPENLIVRLAALVHDIGKPGTFFRDEKGVGHFYGHHVEGYHISRKILHRLRFDNKTIDKVSILVKEHMTRGIQKDSSLKKLMKRVGVENLSLLFALQIADELGSKRNPDISEILHIKQRAEDIISRREPITVKDLAIDGNDLIEIGIQPGPAVGKVLEKLLNITWERPELNNRQDLLSYVKDKT